MFLLLLYKPGAHVRSFIPDVSSSTMGRICKVMLEILKSFPDNYIGVTTLRERVNIYLF